MPYLIRTTSSLLLCGVPPAVTAHAAVAGILAYCGVVGRIRVVRVRCATVFDPRSK